MILLDGASPRTPRGRKRGPDAPCRTREARTCAPWPSPTPIEYNILAGTGLHWTGGAMLTRPALPSTVIVCPSSMRRVASGTLSTAGSPYSRATMAPWDS